MIAIKSKRATTRNSRSNLKLLFGVMTIFVLISIVAIGHTYYTPKTYEVKEIFISSGDNCWDIYKEYSSNEITWFEFVEQVEELNDCNSGDLKVGQALLIPTKGE